MDKALACVVGTLREESDLVFLPCEPIYLWRCSWEANSKQLYMQCRNSIRIEQSITSLWTWGNNLTWIWNPQECVSGSQNLLCLQVRVNSK